MKLAEAHIMTINVLEWTPKMLDKLSIGENILDYKAMENGINE